MLTGTAKLRRKNDMRPPSYFLICFKNDDKMPSRFPAGLRVKALCPHFGQVSGGNDSRASDCGAYVVDQPHLGQANCMGWGLTGMTASLRGSVELLLNSITQVRHFVSHEGIRSKRSVIPSLDAAVPPGTTAQTHTKEGQGSAHAHHHENSAFSCTAICRMIESGG